MTGLVVEARGLHALSYEFALLCVAAGAMPQVGAANIRDVQQVLLELSASWRKLRNCKKNVLVGADPALVLVMDSAFSRDAEQVFLCFEEMARNICDRLRRKVSLEVRDLQELMRFVSQELRQTFDGVVSAARSVAEIVAKDAGKLAVTDELTGLANRRALHDLVLRMDAEGWPHDCVAVLHVDLDRFKTINDTMGHAAGDEALRHAARAMAIGMGETDFLARVGGDEFVLVFFGDLSDDWIEARANRIIADISAPFVFDGKQCAIGGSIGIARGLKSDGTKLDHYINNADMALHSVKNTTRGTVRFFTPGLRTQFEELEELLAHIRSGMTNGEFEPFFQPQVEGRSGKVVGVEALARWNHPTRGLLTPFHFLDVAKDAGLLESLDRFLMERTFACMRQWLDAGYDIPQISINITASRLREVDLVDTLLAEAAKHNLSPVLIGVEILESVMIENHSKRMIENVHNLSAAGFKVELDDFGTGHASISNLSNFNVDRIKIDRSFVKDVHLYSELAKITSAMIGLAHSLRIDALAEGVETPEERLVLNALGCDHIQGFGVARPMPASDVSAWLENTQNVQSLPPRRKHDSTGMAQYVAR